VLSYQHAYHAGNHADVLKHLTLMSVLKKLTIKAKPMFYLDTHAGAGVYQMEDENGALNAEFEQGVLKFQSLLGNSNNEIVKDYLAITSGFTKAKQYPGSPIIADYLLRETDNAHAADLHPQASQDLKKHLRRSKLSAHQRDGYEALNAFMPPKPNRGTVLVDPPYEQASEYAEVYKAITSALSAWPNGCFLIWYPLLSPTRVDRKTKEVAENPKAGLSEEMIAKLGALAAKSVLNIQLCVSQPSPQIGMYGSGMCIINPPWQLEQDLSVVLATLQTVFTGDKDKDTSHLCQVNWIKTEV
jgi:23S rRNA (adenine2030-N6)-methyltransferase